MSYLSSQSAGELSPEDEYRLIERAQAGDSEAMEQLLAAHQDVAYRTALKFVSGREEAAFELAQEVLVSAFRHINQFRGRSRFRTWLYRITANLAKNRYVVENRERARYSSLDEPIGDDDKTRDWADGAVDPRTAAGDREAIALLQERLAELEPEWREVLILRYFEDQSYEEIAEALQLPLGTVKSRINRARLALREKMKDMLEERRQ